MTSPTLAHIAETASDHPALTVYLTGMTAMLAALTAIAASRPRAFDMAVERLRPPCRAGHDGRHVVARLAGDAAGHRRAPGLAAVMGGRHREGLPYEPVRPRPWDGHWRAQAAELDGREPAWWVMYGLWSRMFWAFAAWPVPYALIVDARTPEALREAMRDAETAAAGEWS